MQILNRVVIMFWLKLTIIRAVSCTSDHAAFRIYWYEFCKSFRRSRRSLYSPAEHNQHNHKVHKITQMILQKYFPKHNFKYKNYTAQSQACQKGIKNKLQIF